MWFNKKALLLISLIETCSASYPVFYTYEPLTGVADHAAIDQDQLQIETEVGKLSDSGFANAREIYKKGANSKPYAFVTLVTPISDPLTAGTAVSGKTEAGTAVDGILLNEAPAGATFLEIQYVTSQVLGEHVQCKVGGSVSPIFTGCFGAQGSLTIGTTTGLTVEYVYDPAKDNRNDRTIAGFSEKAQETMLECPSNCPYPEFQKFYDYYGAADYADRWITAAFDRTSTDFTNGNANFANLDMEGVSEAIKKGTAYMAVWMYVIREMEDALDDCVFGCGFDECNDDKVHAWDEAVAFYHGSLQETSGEGYLLYSLANKRCANFGTCGDESDEATGVAWVNSEIFDQFNEGKTHLLNARCSEARANKNRIVQLMTIPLIQGVLRYAYLRGVLGDTSDKALAEGATFAAAVLPMVHGCKIGANTHSLQATRIYEQMRMTDPVRPNFKAVKDGFQFAYSCLNITCREVGGLLDDNGNYYDGAEPCGPGNEDVSYAPIYASAALSGLSIAGLAVGSALSTGAAIFTLW